MLKGSGNSMVDGVIEKKVYCDKCNGSGLVDDLDGDGYKGQVFCQECNGKGYWIERS